MKRALISLTAVAFMIGLCSQQAEARPCCRYRTVPVYGPANGPVAVRIQPRPWWRRWNPRPWSLGVHLTGVTTKQRLGHEGVALGGIGGNIRFRGYRLGGEVSLDILANQFLDGGVERLSVPLQASGLLYLIPQGQFQLYVLGGPQVVISHVKWNLSNLQTDQVFTQVGLHAGVGAELYLSPVFALTADLRAFGLVRNDEGNDGQYYAGVEGQTAVPSETAGMQLKLGVSFRF